MTAEELARRQERAQTEPMVIADKGDHLTVYSPATGGRVYQVKRSAEGSSCTCPDFTKHAEDPEWRCKHILAVEFKKDVDTAMEAAEDLPTTKQSVPVVTVSESRMLIKRSVSPDGRIDSLSVEFSCPVNGVRREIDSKARDFLKLQDEIVDRFLNGQARQEQEPERRDPDPDGAVDAEMIDVGGTDGKWGRRLFIRISVDGRVLWHFGNKRQLKDCIVQAGYPTVAEQLRENLRLNIPCRVILEPSDNGSYVNVARVLPAQDRGRWQ